MDMIFRGLASPQNAYSLGRPDIDAAERPGAILMGLVREAVHGGSFDLAADPVERGAGPRRARPQARPRPDYTVFDHDHDLDADLTA